MTIAKEVDARKNRIDATAAWDLVAQAESIVVAKGKKVQRFAAVAGEKEAVLKNIMGPSGNLRAPTYQVGQDFVVGFNPDLYREWFK